MTLGELETKLALMTGQEMQLADGAGDTALSSSKRAQYASYIGRLEPATWPILLSYVMSVD